METLFNTKEVFKFAYKYASAINRRYSIGFLRNNRNWDSVFFGGAVYELHFKLGERGQRNRYIGFFTLNEIDYENFKHLKWLKNETSTDNGKKIAVNIEVEGRSPSIYVVIDKCQLEEYIKEAINQLHSINKNVWNNYWEDDRYILMPNDNVINSLASHVK